MQCTQSCLRVKIWAKVGDFSLTSRYFASMTATMRCRCASLAAALSAATRLRSSSTAAFRAAYRPMAASLSRSLTTSSARFPCT